MESFSIGGRGYLVKRLQTALGIGVDGDFGGLTDRAVRGVQKDLGLVENGLAEATVWGAKGLAWPEAFERCLNLVGEFEGTNFDKAEGPHETGDSAGVTFGIVGFTSYNGEVQELLRSLRAAIPEKFALDGNSIMGAMDYNDLVETIEVGALNGIFATRWIDGEGRVRSTLKEFLRWLGGWPEMIALQMDRTRTRYWAVGVSQAEKLFQGLQGLQGLQGQEAAIPARALCLMLDIAVQDGGLKNFELASLVGRFLNNQVALEDRLILVAETVIKRVTDAGRPASSIKAVTDRKRCIARGHGIVNGDRYDLGAMAL